MEALKELILNKCESLKDANGISADDVVNLEAFIEKASDGKYTNYITSQIPLEKYSLSKTSVNLESTLGLLGKLVNELEIGAVTKTNDLDTTIQMTRDLIRYFKQALDFLVAIDQLSESQIAMLSDFEYVAMNGDNFDNIGKRVPLVKALLETDLKDVIGIRSNLTKLQDKAVVGKDDNVNNFYMVECKDIIWADYNKLLDMYNTCKDESDSDALKQYDVMTSIRLLFEQAELIVPNSAHSMTVDDILMLHAQRDKLINHYKRVLDMLESFDMKLYTKEYFDYILALQDKNPKTPFEELFILFHNRKLVTELKGKNLTWYTMIPLSIDIL